MSDDIRDILAVRALLERSSVRPGKEDELHLLVDVKAVGAPVESARPALSVVFVLDASGSMDGQPLQQVIASVDMLVDLLAPEDKVGVVSFSDSAAEVCALQPLTPESKRLIKRRTAGIRSLNSTSIEAGILKAQAMLGARNAHERQVILLLSDGAPNVGAALAADLARVVEPLRQNASVSTLGYGGNHNSDVLHSIAQAGGGQYWFISDPQEASVEFARAVGAQGDIVADNIELVLAPHERWEVRDILGHKPRFSKDGPLVALPDLREKQSRLVVARLAVKAPAEVGRCDVIDAVVRYRAAGDALLRTTQTRVIVDVADREPALVLEAHQAAMMARAELVRKDATAAADRGNFDQAAGALRGIIVELQKVPGYRAADGTPLSECVEQLIDEATEYEQRPSRERYARFKATQLGVEVSQGAKHAAAWGSASSKSMRLMAAATGPALPGVVVVRDPSGRELQRLPILPEMTLGRAPDNEICVASGMLSRRHTRFVCREGKVVVVDLASTNGTYVNGERVSSPRTLANDDKVMIGDVQIQIIVDPK